MNQYIDVESDGAAEDFVAALRLVLDIHTVPGELRITDDDEAQRLSREVSELRDLADGWPRIPLSNQMQLLSDTIHRIIAQPERTEERSSLWVPGVRPNVLVDYSPLVLSTSSTRAHSAVPRRSIAGNLSWVLLDESPVSLRLIDGDEIDSRESFKQLLETAIDDFSLDTIDGWASLDDAVFSPASDDPHLPTQVLRPGGLSSLPFEGDRVVFMPTRTSVVVAPATNPEAVARAAELIEYFGDTSQHMSLRPIVGRHGNWQLFEPAPEHPAHVACARLRLLEAVAIAEYQKVLLADLVDPEIHIGSLQLVETGTQRQSLATWVSQTRSLLPKADLVALADDNGAPLFAVPWDDVQRIAGARLHQTDHFPTRWLTFDSPNETELKALEEARVPLAG